MLVIRPIASGDLDALYGLAEITGAGFTSLPANKALLEEKICRSIQAFQAEIAEPGEHCYLMVAEESDSGAVVGCCAIEAAVGLNDAFYHYNLGKVVHSSKALNIHKSIQTLTLCNDYTGATELCTLFLHPDYRHSGNGQLLSRSRYLLMAAHPQRFANTVIAEMRGVSDDSGASPFWSWLQEHFFGLDFPTADYMTGMGNKVFIAELMPKYPIYVSLLSQQAQAVIGKVHPNTQPALHMLQREGFRYNGYVDIFDAGPTVECELSQIKTVAESQSATVGFGEVEAQPQYLLANPALARFRTTVGSAQQTPTGELLISPATAARLQINPGDSIRYTPLHSKPSSAAQAESTQGKQS